MIGGVSAGVVVLRRSDTDTLTPVASWPSGKRDSRRLADVIERALRERKGVVLRHESDGDPPDRKGDLYFHLAYPVWGDEAALNLSLLTRDYGQLLEPLEYHQVAPLLFLWLQRTALLLFGADEYSLRLLSLLAGVAALLLFARLARRELEPIPQAIAIGIFAVSFALVRHSCESKPYAIDLLLSTLIIYLVARLERRLAFGSAVTLSAVSAVSIWLSFSVSFICVGASLALAITALRERSRSRMLAWLGFNLAVGASFGAYWFVFLSTQSSRATTGYLREFWAGSFPITDSVVGFIGWLVKIHCVQCQVLTGSPALVIAC